MSSSRSLSGELLCLYSEALDSRFQLVSFWLPILCERPRLARRLDDVLSSASSAAPPCALSEPEWWKSWRRFSKLRAHGPSFCQFTLWKAMMQCRLPPTCEQGSFLSVRLRLRTLYLISDIWKSGCEMGNLFSFAALNPPLCVTDVQVFWVLCVEVGHDVHPSEKRRSMFNSSSTLNMAETEQRRSLLFTVNRWVFPAGLSNEDPVLRFIGGERAPSQETDQLSEGLRLAIIFFFIELVVWS